MVEAISGQEQKEKETSYLDEACLVYHPPPSPRPILQTPNAVAHETGIQQPLFRLFLFSVATLGCRLLFIYCFLDLPTCFNYCCPNVLHHFLQASLRLGLLSRKFSRDELVRAGILQDKTPGQLASERAKTAGRVFRHLQHRSDGYAADILAADGKVGGGWEAGGRKGVVGISYFPSRCV